MKRRTNQKKYKEYKHFSSFIYIDIYIKYIRLYVNMCKFICMYTYMWVYTCLYLYSYVYTYEYKCIYIYIYTYIYTYIRWLFLFDPFVRVSNDELDEFYGNMWSKTVQMKRAYKHMYIYLYVCIICESEKIYLHTLVVPFWSSVY
jgi:hypothetical protein